MAILQTPLGELTVLPGTVAVFKEPTSKGSEEKGDGEGSGDEGRDGW